MPWTRPLFFVPEQELRHGEAFHEAEEQWTVEAMSIVLFTVEQGSLLGLFSERESDAGPFALYQPAIRSPMGRTVQFELLDPAQASL